MQNKIVALSMVGAAAAAVAPTYGGAATTTYACNPAHSYPNGASCISTAGSLTLVTQSASVSVDVPEPYRTPSVSVDVPEPLRTESAGYTGACNPAHSYPGQQSCISTAGSLTLVGPSVSVDVPEPYRTPEVTVSVDVPEPLRTESAGYTGACNPAHSYPGQQSCIATKGSLTLVGPSVSVDVPEPLRTPSVTVSVDVPEPLRTEPAGYTGACNPAHSYPGQQSCISTKGSLTLVGPSVSVDVPEPLRTPSVSVDVPEPLRTPSVSVDVPEPLRTPSVSVDVPEPLRTATLTTAVGNGTRPGASSTAHYSAPAQYTGAAVANVVSGAAAGVAALFGALFL